MKMMQSEEKQEEDEHNKKVQVAPNIKTGGSHPQATSDADEAEQGKREEPERRGEGE